MIKPRLAMLQPRVSTLDTSLAPDLPKVADPYYSSDDHRVWAGKVIERAGGKCQDPKHVDTGRPYRVVADHIKNRQDYPHLALDLSNGMSRCWPCHTRKSYDDRAERHRGDTPGGVPQK